MKNLIYTICNKNYESLFMIWKESLQKHSSADILVICSNDFTKRDDVLTHEVETFDYQFTTKYVINNYEKITEYDNILYLDTDILCKKHFDDLFSIIDDDKDIIHGVKEGDSLRHAGPFHRFMHIDQNNIDEKLLAYNAGTFGFNKKMLPFFKEFIEFIKNERTQRKHDTFFGEQPFFNMFFNWQKGLLEPTLWEYIYFIDFGINARSLEESSLIHFLGAYGDPNFKINLINQYK